MENASKALIIAGAILIAIVLVSVGVLVVNSFNSDDAISKMDQQQKDTFNSTFQSNAGDKVRGTVVKTLISSVITNNATYSGETAKTITIKSDLAEKTKGDGSNAADDLSQLSNAINTQHRYKVEISYSEGLVHTITISSAAT